MDGEPPEVEDKKTEGEDVIDPVMKQYMEMVQQQKDKEKEVCLLSVFYFYIFRSSISFDVHTITLQVLNLVNNILTNYPI
jgi:L-fucose mutarotase/ribose pyranase (RbsD/FucU family)